MPDTQKQTTETRPQAKAKRGPGRPRIEFDLDLVEGLGRIGATAEEMAHLLPASRSTIEHRMADPDSDFHKAYKRGLAQLKCSLRRKQIQLADDGNVTMLVWLGKQHLGQRDRFEQESSVRLRLEKTEPLEDWDLEVARRYVAGTRKVH